MLDSPQGKMPEAAEKDASNSSTDGSVIGVVEEDSRRKSKNIFLRFNYYMEKLGGETTGINRVPEDQRHDDSYWNSATMWLSADLGIAAFALGCLGITSFNLSIRDSMAVIICFSFLGTLPVALLSTFGPPTGMRQMILSRYFFGSVGSRICAFLNSLTCIGWSSVNTVSAVNSLHVVNHGGLPQWGGIILVSIVSLIIALFGYRMVHFYGRWAWVPNMIVLFVIAINLGQDHLMDWQTLSKGSTEAGNVLSYGGTIYGFAAGWGPYSSDYTCYKPKNTNKFKVCVWIIFWSCVGCIVPMLLGAFTAQRTITSQAYQDAYDESKVGGLLWMVLVEDKLHGFGQVCIVVLALSVIANNVPNLYTFSVSAQAVLPGFEYIPQYIWTCIITGAAIGISIPAVNHFDEFLGDFMDIIAYWISFYYGICLSEHLFFRRSYDNYNLEAYNSFVKLPFGLSAIFAGCAGVAGCVVGMCQSWYVGPIGRMIGKDGGDIGFELAFGFAFVGLVLTRWLEMWIYPDESYVWGTGDAWWRFGKLFPQSKFHLPETPSWAPKIDDRFKWARKKDVPPPGENDHVLSAVSGWSGKYRRNRGIEEW